MEGKQLSNKSTVFVITHKPYEKKIADQHFVLLQVGAEGKDHFCDFADDNGKDNISSKNKNYCELTGLYWIWKNCKNIDYIGICHYRRYFGSLISYAIKVVFGANYFLTKSNRLIKDLQENDIIVPRPCNYHGTSIREIYEKYHIIGDLMVAKDVIKNYYPDYYDSFVDIIETDKLIRYNMMFCRRELLDEYCSWLFPVLEKIEARLDISQYDDYQKRVFGFLSERLFNVWLKKKQLNVKYRYVINIEDPNCIIWWLGRKHAKK